MGVTLRLIAATLVLLALSPASGLASIESHHPVGVGTEVVYAYDAGDASTTPSANTRVATGAIELRASNRAGVLAAADAPRRAAKPATSGERFGLMMRSQRGSVGGGGRLPVPGVPSGRTVSQFGSDVMRWGTGDAAARARIGTLTREELEGAGVTSGMARSWADFYRNEIIRNPSNPSARGRAELMDAATRILGG